MAHDLYATFYRRQGSDTIATVDAGGILTAIIQVLKMGNDYLQSILDHLDFRLEKSEHQKE